MAPSSCRRGRGRRTTERPASRPFLAYGDSRLSEPGKWIGSLSLEAGRKYVSAKTRAEVATKLADLMEAQRHGRLITARPQTMEQFLELWLEEVVKPTVRPLTHAGYSVNVHKHLIPTIGRVRLDRLTPQHVQQMMNDRLKAGFSPRSVGYVRQVLRTALQVAVRWQLVHQNVAQMTDAPRREHKVYQPLDPEEARRFLDGIKGDRLEALYTVALSLGLRQGEALGLRWSDIDLDKATLRVNYQLQRIDTHLILVEPKTKRSRRALALPPMIVDSLIEHRVRQVKERLAAKQWGDWDLVFTNLSGNPLQARDVIQKFHLALDKAGVRRIRFHDLRHSCATLLLVQGVSPRVVMDILGHSEIAMTMNLYSHVVPELHREAANRMDAILRH